jgi:hypothetical protein
MLQGPIAITALSSPTVSPPPNSSFLDAFANYLETTIDINQVIAEGDMVAL